MDQALPNGYRISDNLSEIDFPTVTRWLAGTYWTPGIGQEEVEKAARGSSLVMGAYGPGREQVAYTRLVSDKSRFAYIMDVFVDEKHRKKGIAQAMIRFAMEHPEHRVVYLWLLATQDAHEVYRKVGFEPLKYPERWMAISKGRPKKIN
jgi:GNAT superfamily N-acetyltransferase